MHSPYSDLKIVEKAVPGHLLVFLASCVRKEGYEFRMDWVDACNKAAVLPLKDLDELSVARVAKRTDSVVQALVRGLNADNAREALLAACYFMAKLVDEKLWDDVHHVAVTTSLLLLDDFEQDPSVWRVDPQTARRHGGGILTRARIQGLYHRISLDPEAVPS